mmetsp:Transcript_11430/g.29288  ORF Transcript_11430/g.29288 Transcript_11430/m.29288 type:complete len:281 (+) Transcript_11430:102-944(+)
MRRRALLAVAVWGLWLQVARSSPVAGEVHSVTMPEAREDFQLQIMQHETTRQLGARLNIFCRYRYRRVEHGNPETFDYRDARSIILRIIDASNTDVHVDAFWEDLNREATWALWNSLPIQGISMLIQVQGLSSDGIAGHRSSVLTLGDMVPPSPPPRTHDTCTHSAAGGACSSVRYHLTKLFMCGRPTSLPWMAGADGVSELLCGLHRRDIRPQAVCVPYSLEFSRCCCKTAPSAGLEICLGQPAGDVNVCYPGSAMRHPTSCTPGFCPSIKGGLGRPRP